MSDTPEKDFDEFADAMEATLTRFAERIQGFQTEFDKMREQQRSAVVSSPMDVVDMQEIVTRAAALVSSPAVDTEAIAARAAALVPLPANGKDAVVNYDEIHNQIKAALPGYVADAVAKVPLPTIDKDALVREVAALIPVPKDGEDGLSSPEEIRSFIAEERALQWREFFMGVYRPDTEYQRGQAVTWNGSFWIATEDTRSKPETDKTWILAVKHGRDARK